MFGQNIPLGFAGGGGPYEVDFLVVAGGGSGARIAPGYNSGGAGGAGGYRTSFGTTSGGGTSNENKLNFLADGTTYTITIGGGGAKGAGAVAGGSGAASSIVAGATTLVSCLGGGRGAGNNNISPAGTGGSGGGGNGGSYPHGPGAGTTGQGYAGGSYNSSYAGGGGGAGAAGIIRYGGNGLPNGIISVANATSAVVGEIYNSEVWFSGGGQPGGGGRGIGGSADASPYWNTSYGNENSGGGGASASGYYQASYAGSGVVILRMPTSNYTGVTTGSPNVYTEGSDTVLVYKGSGTYVD